MVAPPNVEKDGLRNSSKFDEKNEWGGGGIKLSFSDVKKLQTIVISCDNSFLHGLFHHGIAILNPSIKIPCLSLQLGTAGINFQKHLTVDIQFLS